MAETESEDHRAYRVSGGHEVSLESLACRDHKASADKPAQAVSAE